MALLPAGVHSEVVQAFRLRYTRGDNSMTLNDKALTVVDTNMMVIIFFQEAP
jgi:hypothetical protein